MKIQILQQMQKGQKIAIKIVLIFLALTTFSCKDRIVEDDYYFLNKIAQLTYQTSDSVFGLSRTKVGNNELLKKYYNFRFNDKPFHYKFAVDSITDEIGIDTFNLKENRIKWKVKYAVLDGLFTKEDFNKIFELKPIKWDSTNVFFREKKHFQVKWCDYYCKNSISKPYYNSKKDYAFLIHSQNSKISTTTIYIFKKENEGWSITDKIENVGW